VTPGAGDPSAAAPPQPMRPGPPAAWRPRPYQQLLRGPTYRWWRPLVSVLVAFGSGVVLAVAAWLVLIAILPATTIDAGSDDWSVTPFGFAWTNLLLAAFVPVAMLATWGGYGWSPRWVSSVAPGLRWWWLARCALVAAPVLGVSIVGSEVLSHWAWTPEPSWPWLVLVVLLTTPLQSAGEEYLFRGWIPQLIGSTIPRAGVAALVGGAVSSGLFALAHGQQDGWLFADRFLFGVLASVLVWRTGGLEAGIALHASNNVIGLLLTVGSGSLNDTLNASESTPQFFLIDAVTLLVAVGGILWVARRRRLQRLFVPPAELVPTPLPAPGAGA